MGEGFFSSTIHVFEKKTQVFCSQVKLSSYSRTIVKWLKWLCKVTGFGFFSTFVSFSPRYKGGGARQEDEFSAWAATVGLNLLELSSWGKSVNIFSNKCISLLHV